jgi:hypothetical protein
MALRGFPWLKPLHGHGSMKGQCLFKTLPDQPGVHEKKLFEDEIPFRIHELKVKAGLMFLLQLCSQINVLYNIKVLKSVKAQCFALRLKMTKFHFF